MFEFEPGSFDLGCDVERKLIEVLQRTFLEQPHHSAPERTGPDLFGHRIGHVLAELVGRIAACSASVVSPWTGLTIVVGSKRILAGEVRSDHLDCADPRRSRGMRGGHHLTDLRTVGDGNRKPPGPYDGIVMALTEAGKANTPQAVSSVCPNWAGCWGRSS